MTWILLGMIVLYDIIPEISGIAPI